MAQARGFRCFGWNNRIDTSRRPRLRNLARDAAAPDGSIGALLNAAGIRRVEPCGAIRRRRVARRGRPPLITA